MPQARIKDGHMPKKSTPIQQKMTKYIQRREPLPSKHIEEENPEAAPEDQANTNRATPDGKVSDQAAESPGARVQKLMLAKLLGEERITHDEHDRVQVLLDSLVCGTCGQSGHHWLCPKSMSKDFPMLGNSRLGDRKQ